MAEQTLKAGLPADRSGYRPMPLALMDQMSVCERCWSVVSRFHQEHHDRWHEALDAAVASAAALGPGCPHGPFA